MLLKIVAEIPFLNRKCTDHPSKYKLSISPSCVSYYNLSLTYV